MTDVSSEEIMAAMCMARELAGLSPEQFARELMRLVPQLLATAALVLAMEAGNEPVDSRHLVAAARIAEQPVSAILGELDLYEATIPRLEARIEALEAQMDAASPNVG